MNSIIIIILQLSLFILYCYSFFFNKNLDYKQNRYKFNIYNIEEKFGRKEFGELLKRSRKNGNYTTAIETLEVSLSKNEKLTPAAWTSAIQIYGETKQFSKAINMLIYMKQQGIIPNEMHYGALLQACKISGLPDFALELFNRMEYEKVPRNTVIYNTMISTLGESEQVEQVIEFLNRMTNEGIQKDVKTYSSAITACGKVGRFERAIDLYMQMETENIKPNTITLNAVLTACIQGRQWEKALQLFEEASTKNISRDAVSYSNVIIGLGDSKQFEKARDIFISMDGIVSRDTGTYNAMITTCKRTGHWQYALELLNDMIVSGKILPDNKSFATVITCCGNAGKWQEAMKTYQKMDEIGITKDKVVFNAIINALQTAGQWQQAVNILQAMNVTIPVSITSINPSEIFAQTQELYSEALNEGLLKHWIEKPKVTRKHYEVKSRSLNVTGNNNETLDMASSIDITNKVLDLHGFPLPVAQAAIDRIFQEFLKNKEIKIEDIKVITGKGNHLNTSGTRGVLRVEIEQYIQRFIEPRGYLELEIPENNPGIIIIKNESIKKWIDAKIQSKI